MKSLKKNQYLACYDVFQKWPPEVEFFFNVGTCLMFLFRSFKTSFYSL